MQNLKKLLVIKTFEFQISKIKIKTSFHFSSVLL